MDRFILDEVEMKIVLRPHSDKFVIMKDHPSREYTLTIVDCKLLVCHVNVSDAFYVACNSQLLKTPAIYPYMKTDIRTLNFAKGLSQLSSDDLFQNSIPSKVTIALVDSAALSGDYRLNPFNFHHYDLSSIKVAVKDISVPSDALQVKFSETRGVNILQGYMTLFQGADLVAGEEGINIDREEFFGGYSLFCFNIDSTLTDTGHMPL